LTAELDGDLLPDGASVALHDDGATHRLKVILGTAAQTDPFAPTQDAIDDDMSPRR
jgi:hypothetical protein